MHVVSVVHPAHPLARADQQADGIENDMGSARIAAHVDLEHLLLFRAPSDAAERQAGEPEAAGLEDCASTDHGYFTLAVAGSTCQMVTW
ncbi:hypothetical protein DESUT3_19450 [Desulfuromonas versatilis]|uniref:Uncharacterized protein n=1 Tax=Desulfuromonas versatilis TaxID=2802975 RepID=A0ABM8HSJ6_9BACT|nr:hypothetical protein DESUT3_19450 [Desulfuromonas versatilis]